MGELVKTALEQVQNGLSYKLNKKLVSYKTGQTILRQKGSVMSHVSKFLGWVNKISMLSFVMNKSFERKKDKNRHYHDK